MHSRTWFGNSSLKDDVNCLCLGERWLGEVQGPPRLSRRYQARQARAQRKDLAKTTQRNKNEWMRKLN